jgi:UDP-glucose 4-epimerase
MTSDTVVITGGLGMVGAHVTRALVRSGRRTVVYDAGTDKELVSDVAAHCDMVQGGVEDMPRFMGVLREYQPCAILHFAAQVGPHVELQPWSSLHVNLLGTVNVLECARLGNVLKVIFPSSKMVYGPVALQYQHPVYAPVTEDHPREPNNFYGKLKRATEDIAAHYAELYGLDVIALRFGSSFGPGKRGRHKVAVSALIEAAIDGEPMHMAHGADQCDDLCYSGEAARASLAALTSPSSPGSFRAYNIASGELISLRQIIAVLQQLYPGWDCRAGAGLDYRNMGVGHYFAMAIDKAEQELAFRPQLDFASAVRDYAVLLKVRDQATTGSS